MAEASSINPPPPSTFGVLHQYSASMVNAFRVTDVVEPLSAYFKAEAALASSQIPNSMEYFNLLLSLARGIDYSIANNEIPPGADELPKLLNEILRRKNDAYLQGIVMVLMISVKNACMAGWFSEKEAQELIAYYDEIGSFFCNPRDISVGTSESLSITSTILARFYPQMKMGQVLTSLEVQSGYEAFAVDFLISKTTSHSPEEKIMLFVARMDSLETSACIITPQQVNFLLNGKGVERRTNIFFDPGPQMPTNVTSLLKYGTNLLQAVGQFNGRYVISVAFMSMSPQPEPTALEDYVQPAVSTLDSDIIEGQSRISLNCPISRTRMQVPVKGYSCKHPQCFDYSNFLGMNSRRPSWRCPHCNNYVCFTDLRMDQNIAKVLKEVGGNASDVLISADGSWKAIMECDNDETDPTQPQVVLEGQASIGFPVPQVLDLTEGDDTMDFLFSTENEDIKPPKQMNDTGGVAQEGAPSQDDLWSGVMEFMAANSASPMFTDTIPPSPDNQDGPVRVDSGSVQNELGTAQSISRNSSRTVQALPAKFQTPGSMHRSRTAVPGCGSSSAATFPLAPSTEGLHDVRIDLEMQRFPSPRVSSTRASTVQLSLSQYSTSMQGRSSPALPVGHHITGARASPSPRMNPIQNPSTPRAAPGRFTGFQNDHLQQAFNNIVAPPRVARTPLLARPTAPPSGPGGPPAMRIRLPVPQASQGLSQVPRVGTSVPPGFQPAKITPTIEQRGPQSTSRGGDGSADVASEESWRPSSRMRGSITGRALTDDISHLVIQPSRPIRTGGPPPSNLSAPPHLQKSVPSTRVNLPNTNTPSGNTQGTQ